MVRCNVFFTIEGAPSFGVTIKGGIAAVREQIEESLNSDDAMLSIACHHTNQVYLVQMTKIIAVNIQRERLGA